MKGYKGFDKDLSCRSFKFEEGKTFEENVKPNTCNAGFHFCKMPLDVFNYYPPIMGAKYAEVEALGDIDEESDKIATNKLKINSSISIGGMFKAHFKIAYEKLTYSDTANTSGDYAHANTSGNKAHANTSGYYAHANTSGYYAHANTSGNKAHANTSGDYAHANTSGDYAHANTSGNKAHANTSGYYAHANTSGNKAHANTSGYYAHANTSGDYAHANTSGYYAHANTSGYYAHANTSGNKAHANTSGDYAHANTSGNKAHANTSGNYAHANTSGDEAIACSLGVNSKAKAVNGWIIIVDWQYKNDKYVINNIHSAKAGKKIKGITIMPDTFYWFEDGKLKSEEK